jgi:hypothetical protein
MSYLSFRKSKTAIPIAICRGGRQDDEILFLSDDVTNKDDGFHEIEYSEFENLLNKSQKSQYNKKQKLDLFHQMNLYIRKKSDFITSNNSLQEVFNRLKELSNSSKSVKLHPGSKFEMLPTIDPKKRDTIYITAAAGAGKSYWCKSFVENYDRIWKGKKPIYLFSKLDVDETLDSADCEINRIDLETLLNDPIDINSGEFKNCLMIFDDYDTLSESKEKPLLQAVRKIIDDSLIMGRHMNISVIVISHYNTNGSKSKLILTECNTFVVFPFGSSGYALRYLLEKHVGLDKKEVSAIKNYGSRWVAFNKTYPMYMITENNAKLLYE